MVKSVLVFLVLMGLIAWLGGLFGRGRRRRRR
jgi:hypothetical protein